MNSVSPIYNFDFFLCRRFLPVSGPFLDQWRRFSRTDSSSQVIMIIYLYLQSYLWAVVIKIFILVHSQYTHLYLCGIQVIVALSSSCMKALFGFSRGVSDWWRGSSILMKEPSQWVELAGHDYVLDLIADLELPVDFPKQKSYFIISTDNLTKVRANASLSVSKIRKVASILWGTPQTQQVLKDIVLLCSPRTLFGGGFDSDEELPSSSPLSSRPAYSLPDSEGYYSHGTKTHTNKNKRYIYK